MTYQEHATLAGLRQRESEFGTIDQLAAEIMRLQESKADYVVDTRRMSFVTMPTPTYDERSGIIGTDGTTQSLLTFDADGGTAGGPINEFAHRQIREWAGIPAKYYDRMRAEATGLLDTNVSHWLYDENRDRHTRMVRKIGRAHV